MGQSLEIPLHEQLGIADSIESITADITREEKEFAELLVKHRNDSTVHSMLSSCGNSVKNPANELVHLYEIGDAIKTKFGRKHKAIKALNLKEDWDRLGKLSNHEPLTQGRHRGEHIGTLRDATDEELAEARLIAKRMILAYLKYLEDLSKDESTA
jgi:hypothetical protein